MLNKIKGECHRFFKETFRASAHYQGLEPQKGICPSEMSVHDGCGAIMRQSLLALISELQVDTVAQLHDPVLL
jgi:hypothetical protein